MRLRKTCFVNVLLCSVLLSGCAITSGVSFDLYSSEKLEDHAAVYKDDDPASITVFYMTILPSNLTKEIPVTWSDLNSPLTIDKSTDDYMIVDVILQEGTEEGPDPTLFGYGTDYSNAKVRVRGNSTRDAPQKSYRIKLKDSTGTWKNQDTINLIKHFNDYSRMANALSLDYLRLIPNLTSLRKQFVHLYVKDLISDPPSDVFVDYGLYEHVEHPEKDFLRAHGLDPNGHLYKAINFEFARYPEQLKYNSDPTYDRDVFETILQIDGNENHTKLLQMLDDINNEELDIDEVFDRYFDRDNFFTWLAFNILIDNIDTINQNFLLYSPSNSKKWYILPWDLDAAWGNGTMEGRGWQLGIANYWSWDVAKRLFKNPANVEQLNAKIKELKTIITPEQTETFIQEYLKVVPTFLFRDPDRMHYPYELELFYERVQKFITLPDEMEKLYFENLEKPMPFYLWGVYEENGQLRFEWEHSYDLQGDPIRYRLEVAKDVSFTEIVASVEDLYENVTVIDKPEPGTYFWRVIAVDRKGFEQVPSEKLYDEKLMPHFGIQQIDVR